MTIQRLVDIFADERKDAHIDVKKVTAYVNELEAKLCAEVFLTHEHAPTGAYLFMGLPLPGWKPGDWPPLPPPHPPGYSAEYSFDDYKTVPLLVPPPYDDVYRAFIQLKTDMKQNDTYDAGNSQRLFWQAYNEFARFWNSTHMPINKTPYRGYKE